MNNFKEKIVKEFEDRFEGANTSSESIKVMSVFLLSTIDSLIDEIDGKLGKANPKVIKDSEMTEMYIHGHNQAIKEIKTILQSYKDNK